MIQFPDLSFNGQYLQALNAAVNSTRGYTSSRLGDVIDLGQAFFEIGPDDPRASFLLERKFNLSLAIVEAAWILEGSRNVQPLTQEVAHFVDYSDDGHTLNGAYGYRLRHHFGKDQVEEAVKTLSHDPNSRRVVLSLYGPEDLGASSRDIPCNTSAFVKIRDGKLDLTVINRSNDLFLGLPYNVFTFGVLQIYLARALGVTVGVQRHFTDSLHLYRQHMVRSEKIVAANQLDTVERESAMFNWGYADAVVANSRPIYDGEMDRISSDELRIFLLWSRRQEDTVPVPNALTESAHFFAFIRERAARRRLPSNQ